MILPDMNPEMAAKHSRDSALCKGRFQLLVLKSG